MQLKAYEHDHMKNLVKRSQSQSLESVEPQGSLREFQAAPGKKGNHYHIMTLIPS